MKKFTHTWFWKSKLPERKGQECRVVARGKMNSILVEFKDGYKVVTSRYAVRKIVPILILTLASLACMTSIPNGRPAPAAATTPPPANGSVLPTPEENPAGAVFEIPEPQGLHMCATVTASEALNLRAGPSEKAEHLAYLLSGEQVEVIDLGGWWKVETKAGRVGYANSKYLREEECKH